MVFLIYYLNRSNLGTFRGHLSLNFYLSLYLQLSFWKDMSTNNVDLLPFQRIVGYIVDTHQKDNWILHIILIF